MLRAVASELWVAETPLRYLGIEVGRRMSVVRLADGTLFVHSPAPLNDELRRELDALGKVRYVVPASALHGHLFMEEYAAAYPNSELFAAPGLRRRRRDLDFAGKLGDEPDSRWSGSIDQALFRGHKLITEVVFLHKPTHSLLVGDLCWNVTTGLGIGARLWAGWKTGVRPTRAFRVGIRARDAAQRSLERVLAWDFDRIVTGHGQMVEEAGREALRHGYAWLLDRPSNSVGS